MQEFKYFLTFFLFAVLLNSCANNKENHSYKKDHDPSTDFSFRNPLAPQKAVKVDGIFDLPEAEVETETAFKKYHRWTSQQWSQFEDLYFELVANRFVPRLESNFQFGISYACCSLRHGTKEFFAAAALDENNNAKNIQINTVTTESVYSQFLAFVESSESLATANSDTFEPQLKSISLNRDECSSAFLTLDQFFKDSLDIESQKVGNIFVTAHAPQLLTFINHELLVKVRKHEKQRLFDQFLTEIEQCIKYELDYLDGYGEW